MVWSDSFKWCQRDHILMIQHQAVVVSGIIRGLKMRKLWLLFFKKPPTSYSKMLLRDEKYAR